MIPTSVTATPEHPGSHGSSENRRAWRLAASHRRRRRGARGFQNSRGIVCVRGEGGAGGGQELRGRSRRGRSSAGEPSGRAVFSVQPRNDKTQVFSFKTKKKKKERWNHLQIEIGRKQLGLHSLLRMGPSSAGNVGKQGPGPRGGRPE